MKKKRIPQRYTEHFLLRAHHPIVDVMSFMPDGEDVKVEVRRQGSKSHLYVRAIQGFTY